MNDAVNHPAHYTAGKVECIEAIEAALCCHADPGKAFLTGQAIKYLWRWPMKNGVEDLEKARFYLDRLIDEAKSETRRAERKEDRIVGDGMRCVRYPGASS